MEYNTFIEIAKIVIPAVLVLIMAYALIHTFLSNQLKEKKLDYEMRTQENQLKSKDAIQEHTLPARMQAYERLILLLERNTPHQLITRYNSGDMTAPEYQLLLISSIRNEVEHNITQQLYITNESWMVVRTSVEELIAIVNNQARTLPSEATGRDLAQSILGYFSQPGTIVPNYVAVQQLKTEAAQFFL